MSRESREMYDKLMGDMWASLYQSIGHVVASWAIFEEDLSTTLWRLADVQNAPGACLTAQIPNAARLLDALIALVTLRGGSAALIGKLNKFTQKTHGLGEKRNRIVHDVWTCDPPGPIRNEVKAKGRLVQEARSVSAEDVEAIAVEIEEHDLAFRALVREMYAEKVIPTPSKPPV